MFVCRGCGIAGSARSAMRRASSRVQTCSVVADKCTRSPAHGNRYIPVYPCNAHVYHIFLSVPHCKPILPANKKEGLRSVVRIAVAKTQREGRARQSRGVLWWEFQGRSCE
jgi:hypothetical protein